ncbi:MAG: endonuclease [Sphingobacteriales bacterium SCN 48-20]|uniref:endonuclease/exonuclease/phosphatase family protein n=1 Tax=Terrimonas ferruginea TaxID=249 RepID=UPI000868EA00|nr:endonuclease/exonuclease/phosphatase family protein [Terrimonas ferruginea]MBN8785158.1 endonuclease/exonuclease/phosphatase family protein [Terrimonas ferruginea]ODT90740.1 MAG: endonuclease [Sphingobacteriales bacterium SCN 48-20]OJW41285.1 MAG: endonuclease [Sphingobacteriales bacterium 48-107]
MLKTVFLAVLLVALRATAQDTLTFATYNVSMEAENYVRRGTPGISQAILQQQLATDTNSQIRNIASIIKSVRPDVLLLNEFDYINEPDSGVGAFIQHYLNTGPDAINYPYFFYATVNTGQPSPYDLDNNGKATGVGSDAWGFGNYPGQYGMAVLSRYPFDTTIRTFQRFLWKDMPGALITKKADSTNWYTSEAWAQMPLSSKSHWDIPVKVGNTTIHILASHPTPPTFDGPEDRNGKRNHDEIRFWNDYISGNAKYIYDDRGKHGGLSAKQRFVILGDQNASADEGDAIREGIASLLRNPLVNTQPVPASEGGAASKPNNPNARFHTAFWGMRADYVLPSYYGFKVIGSGVWWPVAGQPGAQWVAKRESSSDHRLVWVKAVVSDK